MVASATIAGGAGRGNSAQDSPNILWFVVEDMSAHFSCYGEKAVETPHVDRLAREGTRFTRAYTTAPVCSPSRSAMITGCYQTRIGAQHHRSGRGSAPIHLPREIVPVPVLDSLPGKANPTLDQRPANGRLYRGRRQDRIARADRRADSRRQNAW